MICTSESKRKFHQYVDKEKVETSTNVEEVRQLKKRLMHLEEETNIMKQELVQSTAERKTTLNDLYQQLKQIQFSLRPENQTLGYKFLKKQEGGRSDGLSQVLYEDWNPTVVIRGGPRAYSVAGPGPGPGPDESTMSDILCIEYNN